MFTQLIEAIRYESVQSGGSQPKVNQPHSYRGRMHPAVGKKAQLKALKAKLRRQGQQAAAVGDTEFNVGKPSSRRVPKHPRKVWELGHEYFYPPTQRAQRRAAAARKKRERQG